MGSILEPERFFNLFVNSNSIVELGFRRMAASLEAELGASSAAGEAELTPDERDALIDQLLKETGASLEGRSIEEIFGPPPSFDPIEQQALVDELEAAARQSELEAGGNASFDLATYLDRAYGSREQIEQRVHDAFERADHDQLHALVASVHAELPRLTGRLSASQMELWLDAYAADAATVGALVDTVVQLDAGAVG